MLLDPPGINTIIAAISAPLNDYLAQKIGFLIKKESIRDKIRQVVTSEYEIYVNKKVFEEVLGTDLILEVLTPLLKI